MPKIENLTSSEFESPKNRKPRILCVDIETAPITGTAWQTYDTSLVWVVRDWYMLSFSAKWIDGKHVTKALPDYKGYKAGSENDKELVTDLWNLLDECDCAIAHNGRRFDFRKSNARFIQNGLPPPSPFRVIDTFETAKRVFSFTSNKLDDLGEYLGCGRKLKTDKDLWRMCLAGDEKAWAKMKAYNRRDTILLEQVYLKLRPWMPTHPNMNVLLSREHGCPNCGSDKLQSRGWTPPTARGRRQQWHCQACGHWSKGSFQAVAKVA